MKIGETLKKKSHNCKREAKPCVWTVKTDFFPKKKKKREKRDSQMKTGPKKWEVLGSLLESYRIKL